MENKNWEDKIHQGSIYWIYFQWAIFSFCKIMQFFQSRQRHTVTLSSSEEDYMTMISVVE